MHKLSGAIDHLHDDRLLSRPEAVQFSGLPQRLFEIKAVTGGGPPFVKIGRRVFYRVGDLRAWIAAHRVHSTSETAGGAE